MAGSVAQSFAGYQEYLEVQLTTPLIPGAHYAFECYVLFGSCSNFASNDYGAALSVSPVFDTTSVAPVSRIPVALDTSVLSDPQSWKKITACFQADSAYEYLILGHFETTCDRQTLAPGVWPLSYYFVDDVSLTADSGCPVLDPPCFSWASISSTEEPGISWSMNNGHLRIQSTNNFEELRIFSMAGAGLFSHSGRCWELQVNLNPFPPGLYIATVLNENQLVIKSFKFPLY